MRNSGTLFANDLRKDRCKALVANVHRLGLTNVVVTNLDGKKLSKMLPRLDRVLLDAPCTGSGIIARDPSVKVKRGQKDWLLTAAIDMVDAGSKTGGYIVYSTCSVAVEENEAVVDHALKTRNVELVSFTSAVNFGVEGLCKYRERRFHPSLNLARRYYPHDGFFVAKLKKTSNKVPERAKKDRSKMEDKVWGEEHWTSDFMDSVVDFEDNSVNRIRLRTCRFWQESNGSAVTKKKKMTARDRKKQRREELVKARGYQQKYPPKAKEESAQDCRNTSTSNPRFPLSAAGKMKTVKTEQSLSSAVKAEIPSRLSALKSKSMKLIMATKARAVDILDLATVKVQALKVKGLESVASVKSRVMETVQQVKANAVARVEMLLTSAKSLKANAAKRLTYAKQAAGSSYSKLRKDMLSYVVFGISSLDNSARTSYRNAKATGVAFIASTRKAIRDRVKARVAAGRSRALKTVDQAKAKANEAKDKASAFAKDGHVRATALGVAGGMTTLGSTGAATGLCAGTAVGAAVGVVPALFTFGLSIPVGAVLGGGAGLFMGAVSGGAAGYGAYAKRGEIQELRSKTVSRISSGVDVVKGKATASAEFIKDKASAARARMVGKSA
eukprot:g2791.t1